MNNNSMRNNDDIKCEGSCESHVGKVCRVSSESKDWPAMTFWYCETAIEEDKRRGFTVIKIEE